MTLLHFDGFDLGDFAQAYALVNSPTSVATTRYGVGRSLSFASSACTASKTITASAEVYAGFAITYVGSSTVNNGFLSFNGDSGATLHLQLRWVNTTTLGLYRGTTLIASASVNEPMGIWYYIEMWATIADAGGRCIVKVDGVTVIDFTGDTKNAGTSTNIDTVIIGKNVSAGGTTGFIIDDLYICNGVGSAPFNTFQGPVQVVTESPVGAGSTTQMTPSSGANYTAVDEQPFSTADYVQGTSGQRDLYAIDNVTSGTILAAQVVGVAKATDASPVSVRGVVKSGATTNVGTAVALSASDITVRGDILTTDPNTGVAWTLANFNAIEAGFEVV